MYYIKLGIMPWSFVNLSSSKVSIQQSILTYLIFDDI